MNTLILRSANIAFLKVCYLKSITLVVTSMLPISLRLSKMCLWHWVLNTSSYNNTRCLHQACYVLTLALWLFIIRLLAGFMLNVQDGFKLEWKWKQGSGTKKNPFNVGADPDNKGDVRIWGDCFVLAVVCNVRITLAFQKQTNRKTVKS